MAGNTGPLIPQTRPAVVLRGWPGSKAMAQASVERVRTTACTVVVDADPTWGVVQSQNGQARALPPVSDGPGR